ncbi:MAG: wax ester/triacylglycerol synthase family O-acyltransferase [Mycobacteriales bacterium]
MAQGHLDRLSSVDAGFLHMEEGGAHMHIGALGIFAGPPPSVEAFRAHIDARLPRLPRYRQRVQQMPLGSGRPVWVEDEHFRLDYHVRHTALPAPGGQRELLSLVDRVIGQRLDRTKPLWEMWLVEGLDGDRWALIAKTHHAMVDGVSGVDLMSVLFDLTPDVQDEPPPAWSPKPTPGAVELLATGAVGLVRNVAEISTKSVSLALHPQDAVRTTVDKVSALVDAVRPLISAAPKTPFNNKPGPHRRVALVDTALADYKAVKSVAGGATVNDVVLAAVAGALGRFLADRGIDTGGLSLRACVPVSLRPDSKRGALGNEIAIMNAPLPVGTADPRERLAAVHAAMDSLKSSKQAEGAKVLTSLENALPPAILARASRLGFSSRLYNLLVTNVPGPQLPIYMLGRQLEELVPLAFLAPEHQLAIGIMSYHGHVTYGLIADADAIPDLDVLAKHLQESLSELVALAAS